MFVVSKNRLCAVNTDNIVGFRVIYNHLRKVFTLEAIDSGDCRYYCLGEFDSEEDALRAMQEILDSLKAYRVPVITID
ncbi:MAG: hypothetical protein IJ728_11940 [Selenomonadaceae bacterium]|nr:hypothetical protein [Selenomonadaceae bacterium]